MDRLQGNKIEDTRELVVETVRASLSRCRLAIMSLLSTQRNQVLFPIKLGNLGPYLALPFTPSRRPFSSMQRCQRYLPRIVSASAVGLVIHGLNLLFLNPESSNVLSPRLIANDQTVKRISQDFSPMADFEARRMTKEDFPGRYPYRDYGLRFWDATHTWVKEFLDVSCSFAPYRDAHRFWIVPDILICLIAFESIDPADVPS